MMALALIPYTLLMDGIYAGLVGTISTVTMGTCWVVKSIYTHQNPDATKVIRELDIERRLKLVESVINTINKQSTKKGKMNDLEKTQIFEMVGSEVNLFNDPIELCLKSLQEIIEQIHHDLTAIDKKIAYHQTKWFNSWRSLNIKSLIETLQFHSRILDCRFNDLTKISVFLADLNK